MGPRKRSKPNPKDDEQSPPMNEHGKQSKTPEVAPSIVSESSKSKALTPQKSAEASGTSTPSSSKSFYGTTWPRGNKSTPVTQVTRESIAVLGGAASKALAAARSSNNLPFDLPSGAKTALRTTSGEGLRRTETNRDSKESKSKLAEADHDPQVDEKAEGAAIQAAEGSNGQESKDTQVAAKESHTNAALQKQTNRVSSGWFGWFSAPEDVGEMDAMAEQSSKTKTGTKDQNTDPAPATSEAEATDTKQHSEKIEERRSWLGMLAPSAKETAKSPTNLPEAAAKAPEELAVAPPMKEVDTQKPPSVSTDPEAATKSYGWAFWSRESQKVPGGSDTNLVKVGELAQSGSPSQSRPERDIINKTSGVPNKVSQPVEPQTTESKDKPDSESVQNQKNAEEERPATPIKQAAKSKNVTTKKAAPDNILLPSFKNTYRTSSRPGLIQQLGRLFQIGAANEPKHVDLCTPPKIKKAIAIGIHGYFPTPLIRSVLGQPTGTSIRFASNAAQAIQKWMQAQGYSCEVEQVALEGEGRIAERVDILWKLLLNWIEKIRSADFVMVSCHSQGVPVAIMLIAKLISFGCLTATRVGVCAMAGVNLGPFSDYKSRWIGGTAGELFDFGRPDSQVSKDYASAIDVVLRFGVRIVFVGSIDDQLVSIDSATFGSLTHPYVYRAVFVDGRIHAPDFLTHLVGFALKLRNLGVSDHGLIRELSSPLAGSLYTGEGHSRIYEDLAVYSLAVENALETTSKFDNLPPVLPSRPASSSGGNVSAANATAGSSGSSSSSSSSQNPYILPFAMRGLLEEDYVKTELYAEITQLIQQFDDWKPSNKALKDVKFRLEGVRSKL